MFPKKCQKCIEFLLDDYKMYSLLQHYRKPLKNRFSFKRIETQEL